MQVKPLRLGLRLKEIDPVEGACRAVAWGFPRPVEDSDLDGRWRAYKDFMVVWLEPTVLDNVLGVHLAVNPKMRGRGWPFVKCMDEMARTARGWINGPGALIVCPPCDAIQPYLGRLGFTFDAESGIWVRNF